MTVHEDFPLSTIVYYKIGGKAKYLLEVKSRADLFDALEFIKKNKITRILPVGLGSNLLLPDTPYDGAIIWFSKSENGIEKKDGLVEVFAAVTLDDLIQFCFVNKLTGLAWAGGLPSTIGGAVRGNVGAFGREIKDSIAKVEVIDLSDETKSIRELKKDELEFSYRNSLVKKNKNLIVVSASFSLSSTDDAGVAKDREEYQSHIEYRKKNHAVEYPSCGSVFKNLREKEEVEKIIDKWGDVRELSEGKWHGKIAMGYVIKRLGFSGFTVGGAEVSEKHGNYILNKQNASSSDIVNIIAAIKDKFHKEFGFYPEPEVEIVN